MTIKFFIKRNIEEKGKFKIFCRITIKRRKSEFVTDFQVIASDWDEYTQRCKSNTSINRGLVKLENKIYDTYQSIIDNEREPLATEIAQIVTGKSLTKHGVNLIEYYEDYISKIIAKGELSQSNIKHNSGTCKILKEYLKRINRPQLKIKDIDLAFLKEFDNYLMIDYRSPLGQKIQRNTANHHHRRLKALLNRALRDEMISRNPYTHFKLKNTKTDRTYLSEEEIKAIRNLDLSNNDSLSKVRDIFLFACNTGIRWNDSQQLKYYHLEEHEGKKYLRFKMHKTHEPVTIPLTNEALQIIIKYKPQDRPAKNDAILPKISGQKFNNYIKHIAELAGINKKVTHHVARHTFATLGLMNGIPIDVVQKLLGHRKLETTRIYAKTLPNTLFSEIKKLNL